MNRFRSRIVALCAAGLITAGSLFAAAPAAGYVDFGKFTASGGKQFVEVEVDASLIKLASVFVDKKDPEVARLLSNLERVRVNVIGMTDENRSATTERVDAIRRELDRDGWKRVATVQEEKGDNVGVYLKQGADDAILGIVVTVISSSNEAVLVNVVGNVKLEQIASLGERLNIDPLRKLDVAAK